MHRLSSSVPPVWFGDIIFIYIAIFRPYLVRGVA
jgi:hypothetical protein